MMARWLAFVLLTFSATAAAQQKPPVLQYGSVTPRHGAIWTTNGVIQDAGGAAGGPIVNGAYPGYSEIGITATGLPFCINSAPITQPYYRLCAGAITTIGSNTGAFFTYNPIGSPAPTPEGLYFQINGQNYAFPGNGQGNILGPTSSVIDDVMIFNNTAGTLAADSGLNIFSGSAGQPLLSGGGFPTPPSFGTLGVGGGGSGDTSLLAHSVLIGEGTSPIGQLLGTNGQLLVGQTGADPIWQTLSGSCTLAANGMITCPANALINVTAISKTANYTVGNGDDHATIYLTGATGGQTITVNALSSYSDANFSISACNKDSRLWTISSADSGAMKLYPGQCNTLSSNGSQLKYWVPQQRYRVTNPLLYVAASGCNDSNDGMVSGSPMCTVNHAQAIFSTDYDAAGTNPEIQLEDGNYTEAMVFTGHLTGENDGIIVNGNSGIPSNVKLFSPSGSNAVFARDGQIVFLQNLETSCASPGLDGVVSSQNSTIDVGNVILGSCDGEHMLATMDGGHVDLDLNVVIAGNAASVYFGQGANAVLEATNQTITCSGSPTMTVATVETVGSGARANFTGSSFAACAGLTGTRAIISNNAELSTGGNCTTGGIASMTFIPGNAAGSVQNGGICD